MADKLTDEQIRQELTAFGEKKIGPITKTTRAIYIKKLNHLKARQKPSVSTARRPSRGRALAGFSSEESDVDDTDVNMSGGRRSTRRRQPKKPAAPTPTRPKVETKVKTVVPVVTRRSEPVAAKRKEVADPQPTLPLAKSLRRSGLRRRSAASSNTRDWPRWDNNANDSTQDDSDDDVNILPFNISRTSDPHTLASAAIQTSLNNTADFDIEGIQHGNGMPDMDSFNSSDSDLDYPESASFMNDSAEPPPMISRSMNTSPGLDSTVASYESSFSKSTHLSPRNSNNTGTRNSSARSGTYDEVNNTELKNEMENARHSNSQYISTFLLVLAGLFFTVLAFSYLQMKAAPPLEQELTVNMCDPNNGTAECITPQDYEKEKQKISTLSFILSKAAGSYDCGSDDENRSLTLKQTLEMMSEELDRKIEQNDVTISLKLLSYNPQWKIRMMDKDGRVTGNMEEVVLLESDAPDLPLWCRLYMAVVRVFTMLLVLAAVALLMTLGINLMRYRRRRHEEESRDVYALVEHIIDILKSHHEASKVNQDLKPYMAIPHVRDMLIAPSDRSKKQSLWNKAVKFLSANESRVRVETQKISGEEFAVWRWLQTCSNGGKVWQGQAFGEYKESGLNSPPQTPAACLKIRNMFDLDMEVEEDWYVRVQDAILDKCGADHGIVHVAVDKTSTEGCVYVKCQNLLSAGEAYKALHGWWFDGNLVTVKFLRLERYHQRFPDTVNLSTPLNPSNTKRLSMSQPYHKSVLEAS